MLFTSFNFILLFPIFLLIYQSLPDKLKVSYLLAASCLFYFNLQPMLLIILVLITCSLYLGVYMLNINYNVKKKRIIFYVCTLIILAPLLFFKYLSSVQILLNLILDKFDLNANFTPSSFILPIGISYYTFMALSYLIDFYNDELEYEKNIQKLGLYLSFFPIILSGPIERAKSFLPQLNNLSNINMINLSKGFNIAIWGYFMKLVVADRVGIYVDAVYNNIQNHNGNTLILASILYPIQVYADLGGYSLISLGIAKILGIEITNNFSRPFFSTSMSELWRRWHISLITWLTDYVFTPLSFYFRRLKKLGVVLSLLITFFVSGMWHGATLNFIIWGLIHGLLLSFETLTGKRRSLIESKYKLNSKKWYVFLTICIVYITFSFSQVFGRIENFDSSIEVITKMIHVRGMVYLDLTTLLYAGFGIMLLFTKDFIEEYFIDSYKYGLLRSPILKLAVQFIILFLILLTGVLNSGQFIYFKY
jgi:alginate O-acetyltransferase complex protein AlgI